MAATQTLSPQLVQKPGMTIVGLQAPFIHVMSPDATNFKAIGPLWERFIHQAERIGNRVGEGMYGVIWARPEAERSHPDELQYLAGVVVTGAVKMPAGMVSRTIPASLFAVFTHRGPIKTIGDTMHGIYRVWLPQSGTTIRAAIRLIDKMGVNGARNRWLAAETRVARLRGNAGNRSGELRRY